MAYAGIYEHGLHFVRHALNERATESLKGASCDKNFHLFPHPVARACLAPWQPAHRVTVPGPVEHRYENERLQLLEKVMPLSVRAAADSFQKYTRSSQCS
jgi:hypothetical protein